MNNQPLDTKIMDMATPVIRVKDIRLTVQGAKEYIRDLKEHDCEDSLNCDWISKGTVLRILEKHFGKSFIQSQQIAEPENVTQKIGSAGNAQDKEGAKA